MLKKSQTRDRLRPVDLARAYGVSTQAVRNYEAAGILPPAARTRSGYRAYTPRHARALAAFLALVPGYGHPRAAAIMRAVNRGDTATAYALIDEGHAELLADRRTLAAVETAVADLVLPSPSPGEASRAASSRGEVPFQAASWGEASPRRELFVGAVARRLGVRPATLRKWERAGVVQPQRDRRTGYRVYRPADLRDALLARQLRRGGYRLHQIAAVIAQVRAAGGVAALESTLADWRDRHLARGRAMLSGAAALDAYLGDRPADGEG